MATAIPNADAEKNFNATEDGVNEFYKRLTEDAETPSETEESQEEPEEDEDQPEEPEDDDSETEEETPEDDEQEDTEEDEESSEDTEDDDEGDKGKKPSKSYASEEALVKIKVDGQEVEASIKDLKRLYGQEASLTRKSQEAAETKKKAEETGQRYYAGLEALLERAKKQAEPYANINFLSLTKDPNVSAEELAALSDAANRAFDNVRYLETELDGVVKKASEERQQAMMTQARETIKILSDPKTGIPGWSEDMYNDIRKFAVSAGMDSQVVNELVDPVAFRVLHMAMQYQKGKNAVVKTKKVDKTPKRIIKGTPEEAIKKSKPQPNKQVMDRLYKSGHVDDATEAFLSRLGSK